MKILPLMQRYGRIYNVKRKLWIFRIPNKILGKIQS